MQILVVVIVANAMIVKLLLALISLASICFLRKWNELLMSMIVIFCCGCWLHTFAN